MPSFAILSSHPVAVALLGTMIGVSLYGFAHPLMVQRAVFRPCGFWRRQAWGSIFSNAFVHADLAHLFFNAFTFWAFGFGLERDIGSMRLLELYACGLLAAAAGTALKHHRDPAYATLGASGPILAVLFAAIVYRPGARLFVLPLPVPIPAPLFALAYLAFTWLASRRRAAGVNHAAHMAGALAGIAFVAWTDPAAFVRAAAFVSNGRFWSGHF